MSHNQLHLISWNINGIRASLKKNTWQSIAMLKPDIFSVQEIKATNEFMDTEDAQKEGYTLHYEYARNRKGYSGVATYTNNSRIASLGSTYSNAVDVVTKKVVNGLGNEEFDIEGRLLTHLFESKSGKTKIAYINGYYPQGGRGDYRIEYKIKFYYAVHSLAQKYREEGYGVILCGDFNTTVGDIDLARPNENRKTTGCLPEERDALNLFLSNGYVDTFRYFYPDKKDAYSYWDQITRARERNVGWRIDYFIVSDDLISTVHDAFIYSDIVGSDHCPVGITLSLN